MHPSVTLFTPHKAPLHSWGHLRRHNEYKQIPLPFLPTQREPSPGLHLTIISTEPNPQPTAIILTDLCCARPDQYISRRVHPETMAPFHWKWPPLACAEIHTLNLPAITSFPVFFFFFVLTWPWLGPTHQPRRRRTSTAVVGFVSCVRSSRSPRRMRPWEIFYGLWIFGPIVWGLLDLMFSFFFFVFLQSGSAPEGVVICAHTFSGHFTSHWLGWAGLATSS